MQPESLPPLQPDMPNWYKASSYESDLGEPLEGDVTDETVGDQQVLFVAGLLSQLGVYAPSAQMPHVLPV